MTTELSAELLENLHAEYHRLENLYPDPLVFCRYREDPLDGELAGLISAALAYGRVEKIVSTLDWLFTRLGPSPRKTLLEAGPADLEELTRGFVYRFHKGPDIALFLWLVKQTLLKEGTLGELFSKNAGGDYGDALSAFSSAILDNSPRPLLDVATLPSSHPTRYLLASPKGGSAAKRLCLYLRWMIRKDELDPGYWEGRYDPANLVVPLDTHVAKVGRRLKMTARKSADWRTASEITAALRLFSPSDPLRYDFCLFRFGMGRLDRKDQSS